MRAEARLTTIESVSEGFQELDSPTPGRSRNMSAIRRTNTKPELQLRSSLHRLGLRFRVDFPIRLDGRIIRPDIVFTRRRLAVFVDGCFWHGCPSHGRTPDTNSEYWTAKLAGNADRDRRQSAQLISDGWTVIRVWEHDSLDTMCDRIRKALADLTE
jgi:DNA mismatch endonuclease (patch repair protein)